MRKFIFSLSVILMTVFCFSISVSASTLETAKRSLSLSDQLDSMEAPDTDTPDTIQPTEKPHSSSHDPNEDNPYYIPEEEQTPDGLSRDTGKTILYVAIGIVILVCLVMLIMGLSGSRNRKN